MSQPDEYLLLQNGQQTGPFPLESLAQMVEAGTIQRDDFVWKDGMPDSVGGLNPLGVFNGIFKIPGQYLITLVVFFVLAGVQFLASQLSGMIPIGGALIDKLDELWSAVFLSRVLGGLYYVNRRKLSWFGE